MSVKAKVMADPATVQFVAASIRSGWLFFCKERERTELVEEKGGEEKATQEQERGRDVRGASEQRRQTQGGFSRRLFSNRSPFSLHTKPLPP
jgi:hypothetical protein